ncbi:B12-binding domain-containing radical SAM protein [Paraflavitalea sp. CAU 1676]|uniref:B12-binding domain-containing radical SAM protein n=1 Tax=Paraflavitalea sp. CAU 1676 TaxID=3032598 RepID=UPI0023DAC976|nr:B12-binding domain-containing radical SAM protein [Paraflavitalea sp. CAU 1676]MDF2189109.1 B12-binding domain-containing radical SAM protein [Paraflavitalea sp. CAU 1676]
MSATVFLLTPPFTQLNTPYPATAYLKGFLNTRNITSFQADLGIETTVALFNRKGLQELFARIGQNTLTAQSENITRIIALQDDYIATIDDVILFLQGHNPTLAHRICKRDFLPEAGRFAQLEDLDWAFGSMGTQDKAKHFATMYLEDLSDLIRECVDEHFGFSRYAERLGRSANSFDELYNALQKEYTYIDQLLIALLQQHMKAVQPKLVAISVPFPGNLYTSLRCGQWIKQNCPGVKVVMGGGFANTELRSLSDPRVFEFYDFITLDDGEAPIENLVHHIEGTRSLEELKRTFTLVDGQVTYFNNKACSDYKQGQVGTPDYSDFQLNKYISAIEVVNPMHRMWSDGRWNKLTMAHGCYWGKCTFCDISLDYIRLYEPIAASLLCDRMEEMIKQTGENGFHFVDEAAPPALMRALALEIIKRKLVVSWWTNIRFEKSFTRDLCLLLKRSGCIAVSGGLEVASDRLLELIQKGITVAQVAQVNRNFTEAGIMVHAYLMYGFPTQTAQETIDSLEMIRQMFGAGILQSAFWHLFTMTAHSPVGLEPAKFNVRRESDGLGSFANNDLVHVDESGADHETFSFGLKKSLFNYMHGIGLNDPLQKWFEFKVPKTKVAPDYITQTLTQDLYATTRPTTKIVWLGKQPAVEHFTKSKKGNSWEMTSLTFQDRREKYSISVGREQGDWLAGMLDQLSVNNAKTYTLQEVMDSYREAGFEDFELFWDNKPVNTLHKVGLLKL